LMIEYIDSRDIAVGEEIILNYGPDWESAWTNHVSKWTALPGSEAYTNANNFNEGESEKAVRTIDEQMIEPYPSNIMTACFVEWWRDYNEFEEIGEDGMTDDTEEIHFEWQGDEFVFDGHHLARPCRVLERKIKGDGGAEYKVQILNKPRQSEESKVETFEKVIAFNVPREAIIFVDQLYSTDHYLESAFRHTIGIPDELWPSEWKDRRKKHKDG